MKYELKLSPVVKENKEQKEWFEAMKQHEIDKRLAQVNLVQDYLMKYFVPKSEYDGKFASLSALEIINLIDTIK